MTEAELQSSPGTAAAKCVSRRRTGSLRRVGMRRLSHSENAGLVETD
jgi:hypothetical protein